MSHTQTTARRGWTVEEFEQFWSRPDLALVPAVSQMVTPDIVGYWPAPFGVVRTAAPYIKVIETLLTGLPDFRLEVAESAASGDFHFVRWIARGTGPDGPFETVGVDRLRLRDGLVCENYVVSGHPFFSWAADRVLVPSS